MAIQENIKPILKTKVFEEDEDGSIKLVEKDFDPNNIHPSLIRLQNYNIPEQLNCLFDDIEAGLFGEEAKTGKFFEYVKSIKLKYPKN